MVPLALTAMEKHSQNDILYDPMKAKNITQQELHNADCIFEWLGLPFDTKVSMEKFKELMSLAS